MDGWLNTCKSIMCDQACVLEVALFEPCVSTCRPIHLHCFPARKICEQNWMVSSQTWPKGPDVWKRVRYGWTLSERQVFPTTANPRVFLTSCLTMCFQAWFCLPKDMEKIQKMIYHNYIMIVKFWNSQGQIHHSPTKIKGPGGETGRNVTVYDLLSAGFVKLDSIHWLVHVKCLKRSIPFRWSSNGIAARRSWCVFNIFED